MERYRIVGITMRLLLLFLLGLTLVSCTTVKPVNLVNDTFVMPEVKTYPEERTVLIAVPVIPVIITIIE